MHRLVSMVVAILFAVSVVAMGMADIGFHSGGDGGMHMAQTVAKTAQEPTGDLDERAPDDGVFHMVCAIGGHSCSGFIAPELGVWALRSTVGRSWSVIAQRTVASLSPEATTPPPRV